MLRFVALGIVATTACTPKLNFVTPDTQSALVVGTAPAKPSCDDIVLSIHRRGGVALMKTDSTLAPACQWRIEEANEAELSRDGGEDAPALRPTNASNVRRGLTDVTGDIDIAAVTAALDAATGAVMRCVENAQEAHPWLRVRIIVNGDAEVKSAITDYRISLGDAVETCVAKALRSAGLPAAREGSATVRYIFGTGAKV